MITVQILINGTAILVRSARNVGTLQDDICIYKVDDTRQIRHKRSDGAAKLAIKMLEGVAEL